MRNLSQKSKVAVIILGIIVIILLGLVARTFSDVISTRVAAPSVKVKSVSQGSTLAVPFKISKTVPAVKIEICRNGAKAQECKALVGIAKKSPATVRIPVAYPTGKATIRVTNRDVRNKPTNIVQFQIPINITKATPTPTPENDVGGGSGGGYGGGGGSGDNGSSDQSNNNDGTSYQLIGLCYESDQTVHASWKPPRNGIRFRKTGESTWLPDIGRCGFSGCRDVVYFDHTDYKTAIIYTGQGGLPPNTDFEFQLVPYYSSPDGSSQNSQVYKFNSGPLPAFGDCRSLL